MKIISRGKRIGVIVLCLLFLTGCQTTAERSGKQQVIFASSNVTGSFYQYAVPVCNLVNEYNPDADFKMTPISTTGTKENFDLMSVGEANVAGGPGIIEFDAFKGEGPWKETGAVNFGIAYVCYLDYVQIVVSGDSEIRSISDLDGKKISVNLKGSSADILAELIFQTLGISYIPQYMENSDAQSALQDGTVDAVVYTGGLGASTLMELAASRKGLNLVPFSEIEAEKISDATDHIYQPRKIPAKSYEGLNHEVLTLSSPTAICVSNDLDEKIVYQIVKTLEEHHEELEQTIHLAAYSTAENTVKEWKEASIPFHPGAEKYFREIGLLE